MTIMISIYSLIIHQLGLDGWIPPPLPVDIDCGLV